MSVERLEVSKSDAAHRRAAELVSRQRKLNQQLDAYFHEVAEVKALLQEEGSLWNGPVFDPPIEAAYSAWSVHGPKETRIELSHVGEAPMMEIKS